MMPDSLMTRFLARGISRSCRSDEALKDCIGGDTGFGPSRVLLMLGHVDLCKVVRNATLLHDRHFSTGRFCSH
jgi:hypothetical protein